jgi:GTP cyclohydrolase IA
MFEEARVAKSNRRDGARSNGGKKAGTSNPPGLRRSNGGSSNRMQPVVRIEPTLPLAAVGKDGQLLTDDQEVEFEGLVRRQLELMGETPEREGLLRTPKRVARSMAWLTRGYRQTAESAVGEGVFAEAHDHMVMVRDIEMYSLCEHHLLPFFGKVHIAYIPDGRILGLSKLPRLVEVFARRLQVQERLTGEIAQAVEDVIAPRGVGVVIEAMHLCMMMRGVEKQNSKTITSALLGSFRDDAKTRDEFLRLAHAL